MTMVSPLHESDVARARDIILERSKGRKFKTAFLLGSGTGKIAENLKDTVSIPYTDLPGFPRLTVKGHEGKVLLGKLNGQDILCLQGRQHTYETHDFTQMKNMIRTVQAIGCEALFVTCASGSLCEDMQPGDLMLISDHINYMGINPLAGPNDNEFGERFTPMDNAWDLDLRTVIKKSAQRCGVDLHEGVYMGFRGPAFETPAEIRMAKNMGADAVGMSGVPECLIARHCGLKVAGCAIITNMAAGLSDEKISHEHTLSQAKLAYDSFEKLITCLATDL